MKTIDSGLPNRKRIGYYRERMARLGYDAKFLVSGILEAGVEPHKEKLELDVDYSQSTLELIGQVRRKLSRNFRGVSRTKS